MLELDYLEDDDGCLTHLPPDSITRLTPPRLQQKPEQCSSVSMSSALHPVFLAVTQRLLLIFAQAPTTPTDWDCPTHSNALIATRVVDVPPLGVSGASRTVGHFASSVMPLERPADMLTFTLRTGRLGNAPSAICCIENHAKILIASYLKALICSFFKISLIQTEGLLSNRLVFLVPHFFLSNYSFLVHQPLQCDPSLSYASELR